MANLQFIEGHASARGSYEVTQLVNSFLGALAHPYEASKPSLMALPTSEAAQRGWPAIAKERAARIAYRAYRRLRFIHAG